MGEGFSEMPRLGTDRDETCSVGLCCHPRGSPGQWMRVREEEVVILQPLLTGGLPPGAEDSSRVSSSALMHKAERVPRLLSCAFQGH